jgi:ABC-type proline/glycine betaine transport system permease subunit
MSENLREQLLLLPAYFQGHLLLTLTAITMGVLISVPLGVWAEQSARVKRPLLPWSVLCKPFQAWRFLRW